MAPLLQLFLNAPEPERQVLLERLHAELVQPVARAVIRSKLGWEASGSRGQDLIDLQGEVALRVLERLRRMMSEPDAGAITDFRAYVAVVAAHVCAHYLRHKNPERHRLRNRLRHLLAHHPELALWREEDGTWRCGLSAWRGRPPAPAPRPLRSADGRLLPESRPGSPLPAALGGSLSAPALADLSTRIFTWAGEPLRFGELADIVAGLTGIGERTAQESPARGEDEEEDPLERIPDPRAGDPPDLDRTAYLRRLWQEIRQLPPAQCAALLLNLRDPQGRGAIALLPLTGVASMREIADALGMPALRFAELWNRLPLDDQTLAGLLGVTRQQVINLRKSARKRLVRRMRDSSR